MKFALFTCLWSCRWFSVCREDYSE